MENIKSITIFGKERITANGVKFIAFSYKDLENNFYTVKFVQNCKNIPNIKGYIKIKFDLKDANIKFDKDNKGTLYITNVVSFEEDKEALAEAEARRIEKMKTFFN